MHTLPCLSKAALEAGVPARFVYWRGYSGRRYLFTHTSAQALSDFEDGVALVAHDGRVLWAGEIGDLVRMTAPAEMRRGTVYVHLLASGMAERRAVIEDFRLPDSDCLRRAA